MSDSVRVAVTTVGADGAAVGTGYSPRPIDGEIAALYVNWGATAPGTSDITITVEADDNHPAITLYAKSNSVADALVYPLVQATGTDGAGIASWYVPIIGSGRVKVVVGDCNALAPAVTVTVYVK